MCIYAVANNGVTALLSAAVNNGVVALCNRKRNRRSSRRSNGAAALRCRSKNEKSTFLLCIVSFYICFLSFLFIFECLCCRRCRSHESRLYLLNSANFVGRWMLGRQCAMLRSMAVRVWSSCLLPTARQMNFYFYFCKSPRAVHLKWCFHVQIALHSSPPSFNLRDDLRRRLRNDCVCSSQKRPPHELARVLFTDPLCVRCSWSWCSLLRRASSCIQTRLEGISF